MLPAHLIERLDGIKAKLDRAEEQMDAQDREWVEWREREESWSADCQVGNGYKRMIFYFYELKPVPPRQRPASANHTIKRRSPLTTTSPYE
jgi:hypothetical protein